MNPKIFVSLIPIVGGKRFVVDNYAYRRHRNWHFRRCIESGSLPCMPRAPTSDLYDMHGVALLVRCTSIDTKVYVYPLFWGDS